MQTHHPQQIVNPAMTPDPETRIAELHRQLGRAIRTIRYIRACIPAETFRPKNEHTHTTLLQRIHNELTRYETAK